MAPPAEPPAEPPAVHVEGAGRADAPSPDLKASPLEKRSEMRTPTPAGFGSHEIPSTAVAVGLMISISRASIGVSAAAPPPSSGTGLGATAGAPTTDDRAGRTERVFLPRAPAVLDASMSR